MNEQLITERTTCRVCGSEELRPVLDMGPMPPANGLIGSRDEEEQYFPLEVVSCASCFHMQLKHTLSREYLFSDYLYFASAAGTVSEHFKSYASELERRYLDGDDLAVDVGSNDGGLLAALSDEIRPLGVEPAKNVAEVAEERGVPTVTEFFDPTVAEDLAGEHGPAKVITANNVLAHIAGLHEFMEAVDVLLAEDGRLVVEIPYLVDLLTETQISTIYHEHLSYFSIASLSNLVEQYDMRIEDVERLDRHGGSIRVHVSRTDHGATVSEYVEDLRVLERIRGIGDAETLDQFARRAERKRTVLKNQIEELSESGATIVGYGASAKGNVLLNYCDVGPDQIEYIMDEMEAKQGRYSPGVNVPIRPLSTFREDDPDFALLLAWNYWDAIREKESEFLEGGGRFIHPTPLPDVFDA